MFGSKNPTARDTEFSPRIENALEATGMAQMQPNLEQNEWYERFMRDHKLNPPIELKKYSEFVGPPIFLPRIGEFFISGAMVGFGIGFVRGLKLSRGMRMRNRLRAGWVNAIRPMFHAAIIFPVMWAVFLGFKVGMPGIRPYMFGWLVPSQRLDHFLLDHYKAAVDFDRSFAIAGVSYIYTRKLGRRLNLLLTTLAFGIPMGLFFLRWHTDILREWKAYYRQSEARDFQLMSQSQLRLDYRDWRYILDTGGVPRPRKSLYEDDIYYDNPRHRWHMEMNQVPKDRYEALRRGEFARRTFVGPIDNVPAQFKQMMLAEDKRVTATGMPVPKPDRLARTDEGLTHILLRDKSKFDDPGNDPSIETAN